MRATLGEETAEDSRTLLDLSVNTAWDEIATNLDDGDRSLKTAFTDTTRTHQLDLVHIGRTLGHRLLADDLFPLDTRKEIVTVDNDVC